jgi:hypothetical protein
MTDNHATNTGLQAGVAKSDITTSDPAVRVNDPMYAKALVLDDGQTKLVIIVMDAVAIGGICDIKDDFLAKLCDRIESELNIPREHILVSATHSHPPGLLLCDDNQQVERTFDAVSRALQNMTPVKVGAGVGHEDRIMMNRALRMKDGKHWTIRHSNPCPPDDEVESVGPIDPEIGVLRIDKMDGRPLAVIFNFACHPYIGVPHGGVTADFPGFACNVIEDNLGDDAMAMFLQGAAGDITPVLYKDVNRPRDSQIHGEMLGLNTLKAINKIKTGEGAINIISETIELPRRTDIPERIEALLQEQGKLLDSLRFMSMNFKTFLPQYLQHTCDPEHPLYYSYRYLHADKMNTDELAAIDAENSRNINKYMDNIRVMEKLTRIQDKIATHKRHKAINDESGESSIAAQVLGIKIGDCVLISAPAELLVQIGFNLKKSSPYEHTLVAAFSNGYMHYAAPSEDYDKGGYEVTECFLGSQWQQIYESTANDIVRRL